MKAPVYIVITPVRDEASYVGRTIESMTRQTILPAQWIIVDDGSTDGTPQLLAAAAAEHSWIRVKTRSDRGSRKSGGGVVEAFYEGLSAIEGERWDFLVKLDGDLSFSPDYFERCLGQFGEDRSLGIGGGTVCSWAGNELHIDSPGDPPFHIRGATKIYRHACWSAIHPLVQAPGWDTIDEINANRHGWSTRTFSGITLIQHKPTGSADGAWRNWYKNGLGSYITGYHPLFMLARCVKRAFRRPFLTASAALMAGFCSGYLKHIPQVDDPALIRYLRRHQLRRLLFLRSIYG